MSNQHTQDSWWNDPKEFKKRWDAAEGDAGVLASESGITRETVQKWRARHGIPLPKPEPRIYAPIVREEPWYYDPEQFKEKWAECSEDAEAFAIMAGISRETAHTWRRRHGIPLPARMGGRSLTPPPPPEPSELAKQVHEQLQKSPECTISGLADKLDVAPSRVRQALGNLQAAGYRVNDPGDINTESMISLDTTPRGATDIDHKMHFAGDVWEFAVVSDVHLGSNHEALPELNAAYDRIQAMGIDTVLNPGDLVSGIDIYGPRQRKHIHKHTYEEQRDYAEKEYPQRDGVKTLIIGGNHDLEGAFGRIGADPVRAVCDKRPDMEYLGEYSAYLTLPNGSRIHLLHPMGGSAYAKSYRPQKLVEAYEGGTKPNMLIIGHWHSALSMSIRSVWTMLAGCFERQNELGVRKGLGEPAVGFWVVKATLAEDGTIPHVATEFFAFHRGRLAGQ